MSFLANKLRCAPAVHNHNPYYIWPHIGTKPKRAPSDILPKYLNAWLKGKGAGIEELLSSKKTESRLTSSCLPCCPIWRFAEQFLTRVNKAKVNRVMQWRYSAAAVAK